MTGWDTLISDDEVVPATLSVAVCLDRPKIKAVTDAREALTRARVADRDPNASAAQSATRDAEAALDAAIAALEAAQTVITVSSIPDPEWRGLLAKHPPTAEQRKQGYAAHPEKFEVAAITRCIAQVQHRGQAMAGPPPEAWVTGTLLPALTAGDREALSGAIQTLNTGSIDVGKLVGAIGTHRSSGPSSTTAPPEASPTASS